MHAKGCFMFRYTSPHGWCYDGASVVFLTIYIWTPGHIWVVNLSASVYYFGTTAVKAISIDDDTLMKFGTLCIIIEMPRACTMLTKPGKQGTGTSPCRQGLGT